MIAWEDGIERSPYGSALREVVQPNAWSSSVWITADGYAYRRFHNAITKTWGEWEGVPTALDLFQQRIGYHLEGGWMSVEQAIGVVAWQPAARRPPPRAPSGGDAPSRA